MMKLTRAEAIANHRKMWNWIADETERRKSVVTKDDYFKFAKLKKIYNGCFCCEYTHNVVAYKVDCNFCPIEWGNSAKTHMCENDVVCFDRPGDMQGFFAQWVDTTDKIPFDWEKAAYLARVIANLPERKE